MKIRDGFVSNSSSSSFIIDFKKGNITESDIKNFLLSLGYEFDDIDYSTAKFLELVQKVSLEKYEERLADYQTRFKKSNDNWMKSYYNDRIEKIKHIISYLKKSGNTLFEIDLSDNSNDADYIPVNEENYECLEYVLQYSDEVFEYFNNH